MRRYLTHSMCSVDVSTVASGSGNGGDGGRRGHLLSSSGPSPASCWILIPLEAGIITLIPVGETGSDRVHKLISGHLLMRGGMGLKPGVPVFFPLHHTTSPPRSLFPFLFKSEIQQELYFFPVLILACIFSLFISLCTVYRQTLEILGVQFQTTAIKKILQ